jgi:hypothetical protein
MNQPPFGQSDKQRSIAACLEAARQFEQTAGILRGRFHAARGRPGGLTRADESYLENHAISDVAGGRSASFNALHPTVKAVVNDFESMLRPANWVDLGIMAGTWGLGSLAYWTNLSKTEPDQVRRATRYVLEVARAMQVAQRLRAKAAELAR